MKRIKKNRSAGTSSENGVFCMVKKYILLALCVIILFSITLLSFYPVKEVSGYFAGGDTLYYCVNSNGIVDYYTNYYTQQLMDDGPENCPHSVYESIIASKRLNLFQKLKINSYVKKIKDNGMVGNHHEGSYGVTFMCVKIDDEKYYSDPYSMDYIEDINKYSEYELPDVIDLSTFMWFIKPSKCDEYWIMERNGYPYPDMDKDNYKGVLSYFRNHHNRMVKKAEYINSIKVQGD